MTRSFLVALLGEVLLFAGCGTVGTPPQTERTVVTQPPEPAVDAGGLPREPVPPRTGGSEPNEASTQQTRAEESGVPAVGTPETTPSGTSGGAKTENARHTEGDAPVQAEPAVVKAPVWDRTPGPNEAKPTEPIVVALAPAEPNDAVAAVFREYAEILKTYVHEDGRVDYGALHRRRLDLKPLLMKLGELDPNAYQRWSREEKLAFWINAYNLKMLDIISRNYPIQSSWWLRLTWPPDDIRHISGIWTDFKLVVMDEEFTLAEIEHRLFQKTFDDPRVYLALTYASQSSPLLRRQPYRGENLDQSLDEQVRRFLSSPQGLQIDRRNMAVRLCALFKPTWWGKEFVHRYGTDKRFKTCDPETRAVLNFITGYLSRGDVYFLEVENYTVEYLNFDWRLNDTSRGY